MGAPSAYLPDKFPLIPKKVPSLKLVGSPLPVIIVYDEPLIDKVGALPDKPML